MFEFKAIKLSDNAQLKVTTLRTAFKFFWESLISHNFSHSNFFKLTRNVNQDHLLISNVFKTNLSKSLSVFFNTKLGNERFIDFGETMD